MKIGKLSKRRCLDITMYVVAFTIIGLLLPAMAFAKKGHEDSGSTEIGNPQVLAMMKKINMQLSERGLNIAIVEIEFYTIGLGRPLNRILQEPFRWVAYDPRRVAQGEDITYLVDQSEGDTASGLTYAQTETAIDDAMDSWDYSKSLKKVEIDKRPDPGVDPDIYDWFYGFGGYGDPFLADIVYAGWLPKAFFDALEPPDGGDYILAVSVTFIFIDGEGNPTDINGDNYIDTALNEIYFNDNWGDPGGTEPTNPWDIDVALPGIDVETVALHESGHSLCLGHFGPPPDAVMNPVYAGLSQTLYPIDVAGMYAVWGSWPK